MACKLDLSMQSHIHTDRSECFFTKTSTLLFTTKFRHNLVQISCYRSWRLFQANKNAQNLQKFKRSDNPIEQLSHQHFQYFKVNVPCNRANHFIFRHINPDQDSIVECCTRKLKDLQQMGIRNKEICEKTL